MSSTICVVTANFKQMIPLAITDQHRSDTEVYLLTYATAGYLPLPFMAESTRNPAINMSQRWK